jgi:single-stranded-DNA-specific exonuclease
MNRDRQDMITEAVEECMENYDGSIFPMFTCEYPSGVVGIVAGRIANEVRRPTIVGRVEDGIVRASGRSIGEFSILNALYEASFRYGIPKKFGGHKKACGLEVEYEHIPQLQEALNRIAAKKLTVEDITEFIDIDGEISSVPSVEEVEELDKLEPFGEENPEPVFALSGPVEQIKWGENWQLASVRGVKFFCDPEIKLIEGQKIHLAVSP